MNALPLALNEAPRRLPLGADDDAFGLRSTADTLLHHGRLAALVFALVLGAAIAYLILAKPVFRADALVQIDSRGRTALLPNLTGAERTAAEGDRTSASGEIEILRSRELVIPVIVAAGADLRIEGARRFGVLPTGARHGVEVEQFRVPYTQLGKDFLLSIDGGQWVLADQNDQALAQGELGKPGRFVIDGEPALLEVRAAAGLPRTQLTLRRENPVTAYEDVLTRLRLFEPSRDSGLVRISFEDSDPARTANVLNGIVNAYLDRHVRRRTEESAQALTFLESQLPEVKVRVERAEEALSAYQRTASAIPLATEAEALLRQSADLGRERVLLQIKRDQLAQTLTPKHPELAAVLTQLVTVEGAVGRVGGKVNRLPVQQRDLLRLQRDVQINTQLYTMLLTQAQQLRVAHAGWLPNARLVDPAVAPIKPVRPHPLAVLSIGAGLAMVLAIAAALLARVLRPTVSDVQDLEAQVGLPTFAVIPESGRQRRLMQGRLKTADDDDLGLHRLLARSAPKDPAIESLRALHLSLALRAHSMPAKTILITSPSAGAGKTFVASNLAALMAKAGKRVVLLETDLRKPGVYKYVGLDGAFAGLTDVLRLKHRLDDVIQRNVFTNMDVILHGTRLRNPAGLLLSNGMEQILATLRERYDHIVIDSAPLLPVGDTLAVGRFADIAMLVVRAEKSSVREAREAVRRLDAAGLSVEGLLYNGAKRVRFSTPSYGYGVASAQASGSFNTERTEHTIIDLSYRTQS